MATADVMEEVDLTPKPLDESERMLSLQVSVRLMVEVAGPCALSR